MKNLIALALLIAITCTHVNAAENRKSVPYTARNGLSNTLNKLTSDSPTTVAYLGGSITQQNGWRVMTQEWLQEEYPSAKLTEIDAGLGGTNSELGAFRVYRDVLQYNPDLIFVEFAVNDGKTAPKKLRESMEGIIRQIWKADPQTDICFVYTISEALLPETESGDYFANAASTMEEVADYYGIPSVYMAYEVPVLTEEGTLLLRADKPKTNEERAKLKGKILFAKDGVHPYIDTGHPVYFEQIENALPEILHTGKAGNHLLPQAMEPNNFEDAVMLPITRTIMEGNWIEIDMQEHPTGKRLRTKTPELWMGSTEEDKITFKFKGSYVGIYGVRGPDTGTLVTTLDQSTRERSMFDKYCGYHRMSGLTFAENLTDKVHTVEIQASDKAIDKEELLAEDSRRKDFWEHPNKYAGNNLYLGAIMIRGELIE